MSFFGWIACGTGFHDWSPWEFESSSDCSQSRHCLRDGCSNVSHQTAHCWSEYSYISDDLCDQERTCERCEAKQNQIAPHNWGDWYYQGANNCWQVRYCIRCEERESQLEHVWNVWKYESPSSCDQRRVCRHCNEGVEYREAEHDDHKWAPTLIRLNCETSEKKCQRCNSRHTIYGQFHKWGNWSKKGPDGQQIRYCLYCDSQDDRWLD